MRLACTILLSLLPFFILKLGAQLPMQSVRGEVSALDTQEPLVGATVQVYWTGGSNSTQTDISGQYKLDEVPVGRFSITIDYLGYEPLREDGILLTAARELVLDYQLQENTILLDAGVEIVAYKNFEPNNELAPLGRSISVEEIQRLPTNYNDPGRTFTSLPGIQASNDLRNDVSIRGNSVYGFLWRLEGVDIPNPNHFPGTGTSGGGITIFSLSMLDRSDFLAGAFPAEYGNTLSGVFDARLRKGNDQQRAYTFRAGLLGLDFATEGPIKKDNSSYLVNYRYSTLGLLNSIGFHLLGERFQNTFQDLSFNVNFEGPSGKSQWNVWGMGGLSSEEFSALPTEDWEYLTDQNQYKFENLVGVIGLKYRYITGDRSYIQLSAAVMTQQNEFLSDTLSVEQVPTRILDSREENGRYTIAGFYKVRPNTQLSIKTGILASNLFFNFHADSLSFEDYSEKEIFNAKGQTYLFQPYTQLQWRPNTKFTMNAGLHASYFALNNNLSVEPRFSTVWYPGPNDKLVLSYGLQSMTPPLGNFFVQTEDDLGNIVQPNLDLELIKSHQVVLAYQHIWNDLFRFSAELYFQYLYDVPVYSGPDRPTWLLNYYGGYAFDDFVSNGLGRNMGVDFMLERAMGTDGWYCILTSSLFDAKFKIDPIQETWYNARYNSNFASSLTLAKEWSFKGGSSLTLGTRMFFNGGMRYIPFREDAIGSNQRFPPLDHAKQYAGRAPNYFRPDARIAYRHNKKSTWLLTLDIQNFINRSNTSLTGRTYDPDLMRWRYSRQSGLTPIISFQIDF